MTVIAYRAGLMCSDSLLVHEVGDRDQFKFTNCIKIIAKRGWLLAVSGSQCPPDHLTTSWFFGSAESDDDLSPRASMRQYRFDMLAVSPKGKLLLWDQRGHGHPLGTKFFSIGSGSELAMGAMEAGASAVEAVRVAIKWSPSCGGRVIVRRRKR